MKHKMHPWENGFFVRAWDEEDGSDMAALHRNAILATSDEFYTKAQRISWAHGLDGKGYAKSAANGEQFLIAVDEDDKPLAFCGFKENEICGLYVDPKHQGRGIGQHLAMRAIANLLQGRPERLFVDSSAPSVSFYEQLGFEVKERVIHDTRGGEKLHAFNMETAPIPYSDEIGPHDGRELELMLKGEKRLAWFPEMDPVDAFAPHVEEGTILRFEWLDWTTHFHAQMKEHMPANMVWPVPCFYYLPGEDERLNALLDLRAEYETMGEGFHLGFERKIGELLDYKPQAIDAFIAQLQTRATKGEVIILDN